MNRNSGGIGVVLLLLLAAGTLNGEEKRTGSALPLSAPDWSSLAREFHRVVGVMSKVDSLGQMAANPDSSQLLRGKALPDINSIVEAAAPFLSNFTGEK